MRRRERRHGLRLRGALALLLGAALGCAVAEAEPDSGTLTRVIDGDSAFVQVNDEELEVRLHGIDAPEFRDPYGPEATRFLRSRAEGRRVELRLVEHDRYGRPVARVSVGGKDLSQLLVSEGLAWHYARYSDDPELARAERAARARQIGIWSLPDPIPPWESRERARAAQAKPGSPELDAAAFRGNRRSRVFHASHCPNFACRNCTVPFGSREEAEAAGFRPAGDCRP